MTSLDRIVSETLSPNSEIRNNGTLSTTHIECLLFSFFFPHQKK